MEDRSLMLHGACHLQLMKKATASQLLRNSSPVEHLRVALQQVTWITFVGIYDNRVSYSGCVHEL